MGRAFQFFDAKHRRFGILDVYDKYKATGVKADASEGPADTYGTEREALPSIIREFNASIIQPGPMNANPLVTDSKQTGTHHTPEK